MGLGSGWGRARASTAAGVPYFSFSCCATNWARRVRVRVRVRVKVRVMVAVRVS